MAELNLPTHIKHARGIVQTAGQIGPLEIKKNLKEYEKDHPTKIDPKDVGTPDDWITDVIDPR